MTTKEEQLNELALLAASPCEMHIDGQCLEGHDCTKCWIATEAARAIYDAGYRKTGDFPLCSISGCEGASTDCHKTCPDSVQNKAIRELIEKAREKSIPCLNTAFVSMRDLIEIAEEMKEEPENE